MEFVLQTNGLTKSYRGNRVLNGVTMNVRRGDIYGFVGENGSGKTTVIRLITGLIHAESGKYLQPFVEQGEKQRRVDTLVDDAQRRYICCSTYKRLERESVCCSRKSKDRERTCRKCRKRTSRSY